MSGFLLDTNVISELAKPQSDPKVVRWINSIHEELCYLSVLTFGEIRKGIALLPAGARRTELENWLDGDLHERFYGRIVPIDENVAERWGTLAAAAKIANAPLPAIDGLLAATALHHHMTFVTRNVTDVAATRVPVFNPWLD